MLTISAAADGAGGVNVVFTMTGGVTAYIVRDGVTTGPYIGGPGPQTVNFPGDAAASHTYAVNIYDVGANLIATATTSFTVLLTSAIVPNGALCLVAGDDYFAADNRAVVFNPNGAPNLTGATVALEISNLTDITAMVDTISGTITNPSSNPTVSFDVPKAVTSQLFVGQPGYLYAVRVTLSSGHTYTLASGNLIVNAP